MWSRRRHRHATVLAAGFLQICALLCSCMHGAAQSTAVASAHDGSIVHAGAQAASPTGADAATSALSIMPQTRVHLDTQAAHLRAARNDVPAVTTGDPLGLPPRGGSERADVFDAHSKRESESAAGRYSGALSTGGSALRDLRSSAAPAQHGTPVFVYGEGSDGAVEGLPEVDDADVVEDCPAEFQDTVLGPGRRLQAFCYRCPCRCQYCCDVQDSVFYRTCRNGNNSDVVCGQARF